MGRPMVAQLILQRMRYSNSAERILCLNISSTRTFVAYHGLDLECTDALANAAADYRCFPMIISNLRQTDAKLGPLPKEILTNALVAATYANHVGAVEFLLKLDANPNHTTLFFSDAFSVAASLGHEEILKMYLARGVTEIQTPYEWDMRIRALNKAARTGRTSIIQLLLDRKHEILLGPSTYDDPIKLAVCSGNKSTVECLLQSRLLHRQAFPNTAADEAKFWRAALRTAADVGNDDVMQLLLQFGSIPPTDLNFVIEDACQHGFTSIARLLLHNSTRVPLAGARF
jgi:hypothetical protein